MAAAYEAARPKPMHAPASGTDTYVQRWRSATVRASDVVLVVMTLWCGTARYVLYPFGVTVENGPEYLGESVHRWNELTHGVETWLLDNSREIRVSTEGGPEWWYVTVEWHRVGGVATPSGFTIRASSDRPNDRVKPISRDLTKRLPLGEITAQGREQLIALNRGLTLATGVDTPEHLDELQALQAGSPGRMDPMYQLAHSLHSEAVAAGLRNPSKWTHEQLGLRGVTDARGHTPTYEAVRTKWIPKGKALAAKDSRRTTRSGQQHRKDQPDE